MVDLPEPDRPVNQRQRGCWPLIAARAALSTSSVLPVDVGGAAQGEIQHAGGDRGVALAVDQDEAAQRAVVGIGLEGDRLVEAAGCSTPISLSSRRLAARCSWVLTSTLCLISVTVRADRARADLQPVGAARQQRLRRPSTAGARRTGRPLPAGRRRRRCTSPRLTSTSSASVSVTACPATARARSPSAVTMRATVRAPARRQHHDLVARRDAAGGQRAGEAAEVLVRAGSPTAPACGTPPSARASRSTLARFPGAPAALGP